MEACKCNRTTIKNVEVWGTGQGHDFDETTCKEDGRQQVFVERCLRNTAGNQLQLSRYYNN
jgi:hypothetical protein